MKKGLILSVLTAGLLCGCSKKSAEAETEAAPTEAVATTKSAADEALLASSLAELEAKVQAQQYDSVIGSLAVLKDMPKTPKEEAAYQRQVQATADSLAARVAAGDQAAKETSRALGAFMTGR